MKNFFKVIGVLIIISFIGSLVTEDKEPNASTQTTNAEQVQDKLAEQPKTRTVQLTKTEEKKDEKLFRYSQCEASHSERYCYCLIGHVKKHLGFIAEMAWLNGGALDDAEGRKALNEAAVLCRDLDTGPAVSSQPIQKTRSAQQTTKDVQKTESQPVQSETQPEQESEIVEETKGQQEQQKAHRFCNADVFYNLITSPEMRSDSNKEYFIKWDVKNIEAINNDGNEICRVDFSTSISGKEQHVFFEETTDGQYEFVPYQDRDINRTLQALESRLSNIDTAKNLIARGADVSYQPEDKTPSFFMSAVWAGSADMVRLCLENGADANGVFEISSYRKGASRMTPLYEIITEDCMYRKKNKRCIEIVDMLLERGADPNIKVKYTDSSGKFQEVGVMEWAFNTELEVQKKLFEHGANIIERPADGMPIIIAMITIPEDYLLEQLELWLSHGLNPNLPDTYNPYKPVYAITYAKEHLGADVVAILEKYGASTTPYKVTDVKWCRNFDEKALCGLFENTTQETIEAVMVYFNLYDKDDIRIGEVAAYGLKIGPKEKWRFTTIGDVPSNTKSFKLRDIAAF